MEVIVLDNKQIEKVRRRMLNPWLMRLAFLARLPLGFLVGIKVRELDAEHCVTEVGYRWLNKNPFKSVFWAVLGMAAELSSGLQVLMRTMEQPHSVAVIVTESTAKFHKKALGRTHFVCEKGAEIHHALEHTIETGEAVTVLCPVKALNAAGESVAEFTFTWSMKRRGS